MLLERAMAHRGMFSRSMLSVVRGDILMTELLEELVQEAGQDPQGAPALPRYAEKVREELRPAGQLHQDLANSHLAVSVHGGFEVTGHGHFDGIENHAECEARNSPG